MKVASSNLCAVLKGAPRHFDDVVTGPDERPEFKILCRRIESTIRAWYNLEFEDLNVREESEIYQKLSTLYRGLHILIVLLGNILLSEHISVVLV